MIDQLNVFILEEKFLEVHKCIETLDCLNPSKFHLGYVEVSFGLDLIK